jgi:hypothetical protein
MMFTLAEKIRFCGVFVFLAGVLCMPFTRTNPKSYLSFFTQVAMEGWLVEYGVAAILTGLVLFVASFFIKR